MIPDELAARLLATFVAELGEQAGALNADVLALESTPRDADRIKSVFRIAHTLKGASRAAGVPAVEELCHALETRLAAAREKTRTLRKRDFTLLFEAADALSDAAARLHGGQGLAGSRLAGLNARLAAAPVAGAPAEQTSTIRAHRPDGPVRVESERLDALLVATSHLVVTGSRIESRPAELAALHDQAARRSAAWDQTGRALRLALERSGAPARMLESVTALSDDLRRMAHDVGLLAAGAAADAKAITLATDDVAHTVHRLRVRPFSEACESLPRLVRDLAGTTGKRVELSVTGAAVEMDRAVLDGLRDALLHLVRNAVDHGLEVPAIRQRAGKEVTGRITIDAAVRGDRIVVEVRDDGAGLDVPAIRATLASRGVTPPDDDEAMARLLFQGGVSTRDTATLVSGRGVGLDAVRDALERVRGSVAVSWVAGGGTTFTLECPPSLATIRALLVAVGPQLVAVPTVHVERLLRVRHEDIRHAEGRPVIPMPAGVVPLTSLAALLPPLVGGAPADPQLVVICTDRGRRLALSVDALLDEQQVVLRPVGRTRLPAISGAALLGSGQLAPVLDVPEVVSRGLSQPAGWPAAPGMDAPPARRRRILVVDDSITTRSLEQSVLEAAGYSVTTAVDGSDAWTRLQEGEINLVVSDVEMPRMDGFELCAALRADKRFRELPVVLVTARETDQDRARGLEAGANAYIGKSSFDQQALLEVIRQLVGQGRQP